ncbi:16313_t:CDS:1, partial [Dentiscutata erythropus]
MNTITLNCLVEDEDPLEDLFLIRINKNLVVDDLQTAIKVKKQKRFADVNTTDLNLWKVDILLDKPSGELKVLENKEHAVIKECLNGTMLYPRQKIIEIFSKVPKENYLSIIVE